MSLEHSTGGNLLRVQGDHSDALRIPDWCGTIASTVSWLDLPPLATWRIRYRPSGQLTKPLAFGNIVTSDIAKDDIAKIDV